MQHLQLNTTLQGGKYKIERVLGQGGFGITYLAMQSSLQRKVAIKEFFMKDFCSRDEATSTMQGASTGSNKLVEQYKRKFIKEAKNLARLSHPNIINVIDVFEENDTVYYVMPYLSGGSLQDYIKSRGAISETEAMKYVRQIAKALKYMHEEQHMCHYDVKPANILLDDKGDAILIDFGISKGYDEGGHETSTTPVGLSEGYAPIEQYQQGLEEFSPASDVYALGATLYFLLHGKRPYSAIQRASGSVLNISNSLSTNIKSIIDASMKVSKQERAKSVDVFLKGIPVHMPPKTNNTSDKIANGWYVFIVLLIIGLIIGLYVINNEKPGLSSPVTQDERHESLNSSFVLKGTVDKFPIEIDLQVTDGQVKGIYKNVTYGSQMPVSGTYKNSSLNLTGKEGSITYYFDLREAGTDRFEGTFSSSSGTTLKTNLTKGNNNNYTNIGNGVGPISVLSQHYSGTSFFKADISRNLYAEQSWDITWPSSGTNCDLTSLQNFLSRTLFDNTSITLLINKFSNSFSVSNENEKWIKVNRKSESNTGWDYDDNYPPDEPFYHVSLKEESIDTEGKITYHFVENIYLGSGTGAGYGQNEKYITYDIKNSRAITFDDVFKYNAVNGIIGLLKTKAINVDDYNCVEVSRIETIHKDLFYIDYAHEIAYFMFEKYEISCGADEMVKLGLKLSDLRAYMN